MSVLIPGLMISLFIVAWFLYQLWNPQEPPLQNQIYYWRTQCKSLHFTSARWMLFKGKCCQSFTLTLNQWCNSIPLESPGWRLLIIQHWHRPTKSINMDLTQTRTPLYAIPSWQSQRMSSWTYHLSSWCSRCRRLKGCSDWWMAGMELEDKMCSVNDEMTLVRDKNVCVAKTSKKAVLDKKEPMCYTLF